MRLRFPWQTTFIALIVFLTAIFVAACGGGVDKQPVKNTANNPNLPDNTLRLSYTVFSEETAVITDANGATLSQEEITALVSASAQSQSDIELIINDETVPAEDINPASIKVGSYMFFIRWEYGYVGGCIRRNGWHLNLHIRDWRANRDITNFHLMGWWQNGPQFGIYNSVTQWCKTTRGNFTAIRNAFIEGLSRYMPYAVAVAAGTALAYIVIPAFAL